MRESCSHAKISREKLYDPGSRVKWQALFGEESRINLEVGVKDKELVIDSSILVEELLRELKRINGDKYLVI